MIWSLLYLLLAALGLGVLIFIHELGHYWMARREGMTVEVFSIGFGKPLFQWQYQGVRWQLCCLPFGGYVRIAGMERQGRLEPYQIAGGFYSKKPFSRIRVALMGPAVNIVFAFIAFSVIWMSGGRLKSFSSSTRLIGQVDPHSGLYALGVRPGDAIAEVNGHSFRSFNDLTYAAVLEDGPLRIGGMHVDYFTQQKNPFTYQFSFAPNTNAMNRLGAVSGTLTPAQYLVYQGAPLPPDAPIRASGIVPGDRIVWVDGVLIFSTGQLVSAVNQSYALATVRRGEMIFVTRIPRIPMADIRLSPSQKAELSDWQHAAQVVGAPSEVYFTPYNLTEDNRVEEPIVYLNEKSEEKMPGTTEEALQVGDRIIAVDGQPIASAAELFACLQVRRIQMIVHHTDRAHALRWDQADQVFVEEIDWPLLHQMIQSIGTDQVVSEGSGLKLLKPIVPKMKLNLSMPDEIKERYEKDFAAQKKAIEENDTVVDKAEALKGLERQQNRLALGVILEDRKVAYNPNPFILFKDVIKEVYRTLTALIMGYVSPKYMSGPIGIIQVMQVSWTESFKEALFWLGMISLNLGILNLLPIPVLDGGHICFSLWEAGTGKPIKAKTMERWVVPFVVLLIAFFIYVTYHDVMRLFK